LLQFFVIEKKMYIYIPAQANATVNSS